MLLGVLLGMLSALTGMAACSSSSSGTTAMSSGPLTGCEIVERKCSRCHETERIPTIRASSPRQVASLVKRMRHKRGSGINPAQGQLITQCIIKRKFGQDVLDAFREGPTDDGS